MSKINAANKLTRNNNCNIKQKYNVIINQNSTFNQDNSINIMLDRGFPYFQNYNCQLNDSNNSNQISSFYECQQLNAKKNKNINNNKDELSKKYNSSVTNKKNLKKNYIKTKKNLSSYNTSKKKDLSPLKKRRKNEIKNDEMETELTNKIDYRYSKKCPIKDMIPNFKENENDNKDCQLFWFAAYGKLMKTKHLLKILKYYNNKPLNQQYKYSELNLKEKTLIIKDFEIYFYENSDKPFIRYVKGGTILTKLYLLTLNQISLIFSYINRIEYRIDYVKLNYLQRKGNYEIINDNSNGIILPYCLIYSLGKYMNINIYTFSNNIDYNKNFDEISFQKNQRISSYTLLNNDNNNYFKNDNDYHNKMNNTNINRLNFKLPNSKKIAKLIKIINLNFPDFSIDDIINYLIPDNKYINSITKINEIKNIFFFKKTNESKYLLSSMVRDTIKGISIQPPQSLFSSFCPCESIIENNNSFKNSDLFQPSNKTFVIKDDYKFQTINTNDKDSDSNNPFIIYLCDNTPKINFPDNQSRINNNSNFNNININNINTTKKNNNINTKIKNNNMKKSNNTSNTENKSKKIINIDNKKHSNNESKQKNKKHRFKTTELDINIIDKENNFINNNKQNNNQSKCEKSSQKNNKEKNYNQNLELDPKKKSNKKLNDMNNKVNQESKKIFKIQRISTDISERKNNSKFSSLGDIKTYKNKKNGSNIISKISIIRNNNTNIFGKLHKSIDSHNNYMAKFGLSRTSILNQKRKKEKNKNNNTMLLNRINMNKKDINNPFYKNE